jgi:hypothetical protein
MTVQILDGIACQAFVLQKLALMVLNAQERLFVNQAFVQPATSQIINAKLSTLAKSIQYVGWMSASRTQIA